MPVAANQTPARVRSAPSRTEWVVLGVVLLAGIAVRVAYPSRLAIEHFDEGVYASNLFFNDEQGNEYPDRHLYAPPLFPWLVEWSMVLFGTGTAGCFAVSIAAGTATIAAVWWVTRNWFGAVAAMSAACLVAFSGPHVAFSRACLTDVPLCLFWTLALGCLAEAVTRDRIGWAIAAGIATALGWWTKYNGWLPLALGFAAIVAWLITARPGWHVAKRAVLLWGAAALTAAILWCPVLWGLQSEGGYSAVAANHARYFHGLAGWWDALRQQVASLGLFRWPGGVAGFLVGALAVLQPTILVLLAEAPSRSDTGVATPSLLTAAFRKWGWKLKGVLIGLGVLWFFFPFHLWNPLFLASVGLAAAAAARRSPAGFPSLSHSLPLWLAASWYFGMLAATPLYRPYPRLALPWLLGASVASVLLLAVVWDWLRAADGAPSTASRRSRFHDDDLVKWVPMMTVACLLTMSIWRWNETLPDDRSDLARAAAQIRGRLVSDTRDASKKDDLAVYVIGEPAVFFHLSAGGLLAAPVANLDFAAPSARRLPVPTFLVFGPHARRSLRFEEEWKERADRFEKLGEWTFRPSLMVLLDHYPPKDVRDPETRPTETLEVYRLR